MNVIAQSRSSQVARLLSNEGRVFALEEQHPRLFSALLSAATSGIPVALVLAGKKELDKVVKRGEKLSPRSSELHRLLAKSVRTPALFH